jgi:hypothetical protein
LLRGRDLIAEWRTVPQFSREPRCVSRGRASRKDPNPPAEFVTACLSGVSHRERKRHGGEKQSLRDSRF